ncbi:twin-arginine translocase TatA/TatE family subunit [Luteimicrobium album]|uniref:twin-arginine translocase TatA/TatE family subunit n=1 Tax=Luteimicrobium album TaxID=1054550 RepID=UPI0024E0C83B|nr:twin-arginine translocase TatA/TatE family subunit [Luteimicrobium album]
MFDINGGEWLVLLVVAVIVIGPERLPGYAEQLARLVKRGREFVTSTRSRLDEELGEGAGVDWQALDPRRYDPRRIVRDALLDDDTRGTLSDVANAVGLSGAGAAKATANPAAPGVPAGAPAPAALDPTASMPFRAGAAFVPGSGPVPWDDEAT